jgi:hypothetical protein
MSDSDREWNKAPPQQTQQIIEVRLSDQRVSIIGSIACDGYLRL